MTDSQKLDAILDELRILRDLLEALLEQRTVSQARPEPARADDPVDADYFAHVSGLSPITIKQGKAGTSDVPLFSMRPRRWLKRDVDRWVRERATRLRSPRQRAHRLLDRKKM